MNKETSVTITIMGVNTIRKGKCGILQFRHNNWFAMISFFFFDVDDIVYLHTISSSIILSLCQICSCLLNIFFINVGQKYYQ
jgi:hypothetical protein